MSDDGDGEGVMTQVGSHEALKTDLPGWNLDQLDYPTFRITLIAKIMDRLTIRYLAEQGEVSYAEWRVLARLATLPDGGTVGLVADLAWVDRAEVSRASTSLEAKGFVSRRENERDRRKPVLCVTEQGREHYQAGLQKRRAFHDSLLVGLSEKDRVVLDELLGRIAERLMDQVKSADTN